jgi:TonB family protein
MPMIEPRTLRPIMIMLTCWYLPLLNAQVEVLEEEVIPPSAIHFEDREFEEDKDVFTIVEQMPGFPGGQEALFKFLGENIRYPKKALNAGIQGVVYVTFVVEQDGTISRARVLRGIGGGCDEESLRVVNSMPTWMPGVQRGKPVRVQYNLPIRYTLREPTKKKKKE